MRSRSRATRRSVALATTLALAACEAPPVAWQEARRGGGGHAAARDGPPAARRGGGAHAAAGDGLPAGVAAGACDGSVRSAVGRGAERYAAWWRPRADSSAVLLVARSTDRGASWGTPVVVDSLDRGVRACAR